MEKEQLELDIQEFTIESFQNNYRNAIFYFKNEERNLKKKQVFLNGAPETRFLLKELGITKYTKDLLLTNPTLFLVFEKRGEGRIIALANLEGEYTLIRDEFSDDGELFSPDRNIAYFAKTYDVYEQQLTDMVEQTVENLIRNKEYIKNNHTK